MSVTRRRNQHYAVSGPTERISQTFGPNLQMAQFSTNMRLLLPSLYVKKLVPKPYKRACKLCGHVKLSSLQNPDATCISKLECEERQRYNASDQ